MLMDGYSSITTCEKNESGLVDRVDPLSSQWTEQNLYSVSAAIKADPEASNNKSWQFRNDHHSITPNETKNVNNRKASMFARFGRWLAKLSSLKRKKEMNQIPYAANSSLSHHDSIGFEKIRIKQSINGEVDKHANQPNDKHLEQSRKDQILMLLGQYLFVPSFTEKYLVKEILGEGSFGFAWIGERRMDGVEVAIKFALRSKIPASSWMLELDMGLIPNEVYFLRKLKGHPNIINYLDYFDDGEKYVYIVTELFGTSWTWPNPKLNQVRNVGLKPASKLRALDDKYGIFNIDGLSAKPIKDPKNCLIKRQPYDLFECIEAHYFLPEPIVKKIFVQIVGALGHLHSQGIVHRDIKDENIAIDENYCIKLIDFGSAAFIPDRQIKEIEAKDREAGTIMPPNIITKATTERPILLPSLSSHLHSPSPSSTDGLFKIFSGTLAFAAPEIVQGRWYKGYPAEIWTLGILLYTMVYRKSPFATNKEIIESTVAFPDRTILDEFKKAKGMQSIELINDLIRRMLAKDPTERITLEQVAAHIWINENA